MRLRLLLPGALAAAVMIAGTSEHPLLAPLRTESTYGLWVAVLYPLAALLAATQCVLWILWAVRRVVRHRS